MEYIIFLILWIGICLLIALSGSGKNIGYWGVFWLSFFLSPLIGLIVGLASASKPLPKRNISEELRIQAGNLIKQGEQEQALELLQKSLNHNPKNIKVLYNLACIYSLRSKLHESLNYLARAVEYGYSNFDLINTDIDLDNLRCTSEFESFKANNYKLAQKSNETQETNLDKIKKLKELLDSGALTQAEFDLQKSKLLNV